MSFENNSRYVIIHTSINEIPIINVSLYVKEPLLPQIRSVLSKSIRKKLSKDNFNSRKLYVRWKDHHMDENDEDALKICLFDFNVPIENKISLMAELDTKNFDNHYQVIRFKTGDERDVNILNSWIGELEKNGEHVDIWKHPKNEDVADIRLRKYVNPSSSGLSYEVLMNDIQKHVKDIHMNKGNSFTTNFHSYKDIISYLTNLSETINQKNNGIYSNMIYIGNTWENRPLYCFKLSKTPQPYRQSIVLLGGTHAREWASISCLVHFLDKSTQNSDILNALNHFDIYVIPCLNADGYEYTRNKNNRYWRKTRSRHFKNFQTIGVDPNRNFDCKFNTVGISDKPSSEIYCGPYPESEPSVYYYTQFLKNINCLGYITFHSYGRYILFPYTYTKSKPEDYDELKACGEAMKAAIEKENGRKYKLGQGSKVLYTCSGTDIDYIKTKGVKFPFCIELPGDKEIGQYGFLINPRSIPNVTNEVNAGVYAMASYILDKNLLEPIYMYIDHDSCSDNYKVKGLKNKGNSCSDNYKVKVLKNKGNSCSDNYKVKGLKNKGNSCYMNSLIQCLSAFPVLSRAYVSNQKNISSSNNEVEIEFGKLIRALHDNTNDNVIDPEFFLKRLYLSYPNFAGAQQQDSQDFFMQLIDNLNGPNQEAFLGEEITENKCNRRQCGKANQVMSDFTSISVSISNKTKSLYDSINEYYSSEVFDARCQNCNNDKQDKQSKIRRFPCVFVVHIKRYTNTLQKLMIPINIDKSINLGMFGEQTNDRYYKLKGIVNHHGKHTNNGHYTAQVNIGNAFYNCNDEVVTNINDFDWKGNKDAYLVFYEYNGGKSL